VVVATGITRPFDAGFFSGPSSAAVATEIGTKWDIAIGGRPYILDLDFGSNEGGYVVKSLPLLQRYYLTQTQGNLGEQSLNPEDYWRRSVDSWENGAGQLFNDHDATTSTNGSIRSRFRKSKGIDPWTPGQFTLLHDTTQIEPSVNDALALAVAGSELHYLDGDTGWSSSTDGTTFTPLTGTALSGAAAITSDGFTVWVVDGTDTYYATRGGTTYSTWFSTPTPGTLVRSVKGRLFVCTGNVVNTSDGTPGAANVTALYTHPNSDWRWVDVAEGPTAIYFAGFSGDKSIIYQTQIASDGTNLVIPSAAATLPSGEIVRAIQGYLGVLMIGTDKGVRVAAIDSQGNLTVGDLITTGESVSCFEPQEQFVWFGWPNYDSTSGLGRINLGTFNDSVPAYATDLMTTDGGPVTSVQTFNDLRYFTISGSGLWAETSTYCPSGSIDSGGLNFALPDIKIAVKFDIQFKAGAGTIIVSSAADDQPFIEIGAPIEATSIQGSNEVLPAGLVSGRTHEIRLTLERDVLDHTQAPIVDRWTLMTNPAPERRVSITAALYLYQELHLRNGSTVKIDPLTERQQINAWMQSNEVITFQDAEVSYAVTVNDFEWHASNQIDPKVRAWEGTMIVQLKEIS